MLKISIITELTLTELTNYNKIIIFNDYNKSLTKLLNMFSIRYFKTKRLKCKCISNYTL